MADLLGDAVEELYSVSPEEFLDRRTQLVAAAKDAGDRAAAQQIGALRKPTRSAWIVNQLARQEPDVVAQLLSLGDALRTAQQSLDGGQLRELSSQRRKVVGALARQALTLAGGSTSQAVRDEVRSTLEAALADPEVGDQLAAGTLVRSMEWSGFGTGAPTLSVVTSSRPSTEERDRKAEREEARRRQARADAEERAARAADALAVAEAAKADAAEDVRVIEERLLDARRRFDQASLDERAARIAERKADGELRRLT